MKPELITIFNEIDYGDAVMRAAAVAEAGGLVVFPTETVYGVGARADLPEAMARLRRLKARTDGKPFTVHVSEPGRAWDYAPDLRGVGARMVRKGWPGPLTILAEVADPAAAPAMRGRPAEAVREAYCHGEVGLRCPDDDVGRRWLGLVEGPVAAASANRAGQAPPCTGAEAVEALGEDVDLVLESGRTRYGRSSTVVRVTAGGFEMVREGVYDERALRQLASLGFLLVCTGNTCRSPMAAGLLSKMVGERLGVEPGELERHWITVRSAGTSARLEAPASPPAGEVMRRRGIDLREHVATPLTPELIHQADRIYAMTERHWQAVVSMVPSAANRTTCLSPEGDITDPIGGDVAVYESCAATIEAALGARLKEVEL